MGMQENIAGMLQAKRQLNRQSIEDWSAELGISHSTLQNYLNGSGNPTVKMIEHLAEQLAIDPVALVAGEMESEQYKIVLLMLDTIKAVSILSQPKRLRFAELFLELVRLWED